MDILENLTNLYAWQVRCGHGASLTMEFGNPHLAIREPIELKANAARISKSLLSRRRINVVGDWHLWIQDADWRIDEGKNFKSRNDRPKIDQAIEFIDGQILQRVSFDATEMISVFYFDLGSKLIVKSNDFESSGLWSIFKIDGTSLTLQRDGVLLAQSPT